MNIRMIIRRLRAALAAGTLVLTLATNADASDHLNVSTGMTLAKAPLAIHGYDPVAFFTRGKAVLGDAEFTATYHGAAYRFATEANQKAFERNPEKYVPQYGGFCAFGVSVGAKFDGDPRLFRVVDGKLYFNLNRKIQKQWLSDVPDNIRKADSNWQQIRDKTPKDLT